MGLLFAVGGCERGARGERVFGVWSLFQGGGWSGCCIEQNLVLKFSYSRLSLNVFGLKVSVCLA